MARTLVGLCSDNSTNGATSSSYNTRECSTSGTSSSSPSPSAGRHSQHSAATPFPTTHTFSPSLPWLLLGRPSSALSVLRPAAGGRGLLPAGGSSACCAATSAGAPQLQQTRGILGAAEKARPHNTNPQIHTHEKYKIDYPQPTYDWMRGRFVLDRNGAIWHRTAGYTHKRYAKTASHLTRLKRWKPVSPGFASKMIKLGFRTKYWAPADPHEVPGFHAAAGEQRSAVRWNAKPDLRPHQGDPALRPH